MRFDSALKHLRLERKMTQAQLADALGLTRSSVSMYELGQREPPFEVLEQMADYFNVDMDFLLGRTDKTTKASPPDDLTLMISKLDPTDLAKTVGFVEGLLSADKYKKDGASKTA